MGNFFKWLLPPSLASLASEVARLASRWRDLGDADLRNKADGLRARARGGERAGRLMTEAFACAVIAAERSIGLRPYDVQIQGGIALAHGKVAEMKTGEGKTLAATLPAFLHSLYGKGVHIVTVNDYLARRDAGWMGPVFERLGATVGCIQETMSDAPDDDVRLRRAAYGADITYVTNAECVFDYLRDNLADSPDHIVHRGRHAAILDELDLLLIDEAQTPLIISGAASDDGALIRRADDAVRRLRPGRDFEVDHRHHAVALTEVGHARISSLLGVGALEAPDNLAWAHAVHQALQAHGIYERDVAYLVQDDAVYIIDEHTGRASPDKRYSNGLHQALEAKERLPIRDEDVTLSKTSYQHYFRSYPHLSGMTGTAWSVRRELEAVYGLEVVRIPTFKPMIRADHKTVLFRTAAEKRTAVAAAVDAANRKGRPVLVGTLSVDESDRVSKMLGAASIPHQVLNARHHAQEAEIIAQAGREGAVTVSTNMAGRGTDIMLGGDARGLAMKALPVASPEFEARYRDMVRQCTAERERVITAGGLLVIGTGEHDAERIDHQLRGRAGRQGDPGASIFYTSLEDPLYKRLGAQKILPVTARVAHHPENVPIEDPVVLKALDAIRRDVETNAAGIRKEVFRFDAVLHERREAIFARRRALLAAGSARNWDESVIETIEDLVERLGDARFEAAGNKAGPLNDAVIWNEVYLEIVNDASLEHTAPAPPRDRDGVVTAIDALIHARRGAPEDNERLAWERSVLLGVIDMLWPLYLNDLEALEDDVHLHAYAEVDPFIAYRTEAARMFGQLMIDIEKTALRAWLSGLLLES